jgi:hypothetical protein
MKTSLGVVLLLLPALARAGEIQGAIGVVGAASEWRDDGAAYASFRLGYRWWHRLAIDGQGWFGHAPVDDRYLTYLTVGASLYGRIKMTRPYLRLGFVHQHEEPATSVRNDPFGATFGVGDGIRHRGGFASSAGLEIPFAQAGRHEWFVAVEGTATWFPDPRGPSWYAGGGAGVGVSFGR